MGAIQAPWIDDVNMVPRPSLVLGSTCDQAGITAYVSKSMTSEAKTDGQFDKSDCVYKPGTDTYRCLAGSQFIFGWPAFRWEQSWGWTGIVDCARPRY